MMWSAAATVAFALFVLKASNALSRPKCDDGSPPANRVNTTERLQKLREQLKVFNLSAYIILSNDDHQSEYISNHDKRREYISGFTGSAGDAVVTLESAAMWTDSRYYIQAEEQMDCNWLLMKNGEDGVPTIEKWIAEQLQPGELASSDPRICTHTEWNQWNETLAEHNVTLTLVTKNLIDEIWGEENGRPPYPDTPIIVLDVKYAGATWQEKITLIREDMKKKEIDTLILTAIDETAWTLNLRGGDVPFTPVFRSYLVIGLHEAVLYLPNRRISDEIVQHLNSSDADKAVRIKNYTEIWTDLPDVGRSSQKIGLPSSYSYAKGVSYLVYQSLPSDKIVMLTSPALLRKDTKNDVESAGMRESHIRDAVALCQFLMRIEEEITFGDTTWTEMKVVSVLDELRTRQNLSFGPSFGTIAAFGINAALPHYEPTNDTDTPIDQSQLLLIDSGGQYLDGTTDVTRTVHLGEPRSIEKEVYTRLLMGCIDIVNTVFKEGYTMNQLEILIRAPLYQVGLDYGHGSTHGIGSFLAVHEAFNSTYHTNFFGSQEPGYYKENDFGIRLENIITVVKANITAETSDKFLTFDTVTLVPYERKLIVPELLEEKHVSWLNNYHQRIRDIVGKEMLQQGLEKEYEWLLNKTEEILFL